MNRLLIGLIGAVACAAPQVSPLDLSNRGLEAAMRGDQAQAERLYRQAIPIWRGMGPSYRPHLATTLTNLGQALCAQGRRREGVDAFEESLALLRGTLGFQHLNTLTTLNVMAGAYVMLGNDARASALFEEALPVERKLYPGDVQLARTLVGMAALRQHAGKPDEALPLAEEGLTIALRAAGENTQDAAVAYAMVAEVHRTAGRPERALPLYRKARAIYTQLLGEAHPRVASILTQEGLILMDEGELSLAEKNMVRALEITRQTCPQCVFELWIGESNLGLLRFKQGRYNDADRLLTDALALEEKSLDRLGPDTAATLQTLAKVREKQRRYEDAEQLHQRAETILAYR